MMKRLQKIFNFIHLAGIILAIVTLTMQLLIIAVNVILRNTYNLTLFGIRVQPWASGLPWMEEMSSNVLMTAFTFLSMAIGVKLKSHINVDIIPKKAPPILHKILDKFTHVVMSLIGFVLCYFGIVLIFSLRGSIASLPVLPISLQYILLPLAGFLILVDSLMSLAGIEKEDHYLDNIFMGIGEKPPEQVVNLASAGDKK
jgi:TRAP-type C4-dicarboxylate transport system permease small subunit